MNRKEYIEKLENEKYNIPCIDLTKGFNNGIDRAIGYAEKLAEPQKVVLNKAEAEWLDKLKEEQNKRTFCDKDIFEQTYKEIEK